MTVILAWLAKNWRLIAYALAAAACVWVVLLVLHWRSDSHKLKAAEEALAAEQRCEPATECFKRISKLADDGAVAVEQARQAAAEAASKAQAEKMAQGEAALRRAQDAAAAAQARQKQAEARLRSSMASDASCAAQAKEVILCDY